MKPSTLWSIRLTLFYHALFCIPVALFIWLPLPSIGLRIIVAISFLFVFCKTVVSTDTFSYAGFGPIFCFLTSVFASVVLVKASLLILFLPLVIISSGLAFRQIHKRQKWLFFQNE